MCVGAAPLCLRLGELLTGEMGYITNTTPSLTPISALILKDENPSQDMSS